jgi:ubiquinone/menaquinone biosynthesis C-methylase UbiE
LDDGSTGMIDLHKYRGKQPKRTVLYLSVFATSHSVISSFDHSEGEAPGGVMDNLIELLSPDILDKSPDDLLFVDRMSKGLIKEIGWHYPVDLVWILNKIKEIGGLPGSEILDAGAGMGLLQYLLAERKFNVTSVDYSPRRIQVFSNLFFRFETIQQGEEQRTEDYVEHVVKQRGYQTRLKRLYFMIRNGFLNPFEMLRLISNRLFGGEKPGMIRMYHADIRKMHAIADSSVDIIVSMSAIEHMPKETISTAVTEFSRVLKPGGHMLVTTSATNGDDLFHKLSQGWCFSIESLLKIFGITWSDADIFEGYEKVLLEYKESEKLKRRLSSVYYATKNSGMPGAVWNPQYVPVGIVVKNNKEMR